MFNSSNANFIGLSSKSPEAAALPMDLATVCNLQTLCRRFDRVASHKRVGARQRENTTNLSMLEAETFVLSDSGPRSPVVISRPQCLKCRAMTNEIAVLPHVGQSIAS